MKRKILIENENILLDAESASISPIFRKQICKLEEYPDDEDYSIIKSRLKLEIDDKEKLENALKRLDDSKKTGFYFSVKDGCGISYTQTFTKETTAKEQWLIIAKRIKEANES